MKLRNIDDVPLLFVRRGDCETVIAMVVRSALAADKEAMQVAYRFIADNIRELSDGALRAVIQEIDAVKDTDSEMLTLICCTVLREEQRRREINANRKFV